MMAWKKKLGKSGEGTSSPTPGTVTVAASSTPSRLVKPALKLSSSIPPDNTKPIDVDAIKNKSKRKLAQEKTPSPPKRRKTNSPLLTDPLDPNVHVADRLQYNLSAKEKQPFKGMTPSESLNMAYELISRASVCLNFTVGTTKPLLVAELEAAQKDLKTVREENAKLTLCIEELTKTAEDDRNKATENLKKAQNEVASLKQSTDTLKLEL